jgi:hypothetical protein
MRVELPAANSTAVASGAVGTRVFIDALPSFERKA